MAVDVVLIPLLKSCSDSVIIRLLVFQTRKALLHWVDVLLLMLGFLLGLDLFALQVFVVDLAQELAFEERVELEVQAFADEAHLDAVALGEVEILALLVGGEGDDAITTMPQGWCVFFAYVDVDVPRETGSMLVTLLESLSPFNYILYADVVFSLVPGRKPREVLRFHSTISVILVDLDEIIALLIVILDIFKRRIEEAFLRPIDMHYSSILA